MCEANFSFSYSKLTPSFAVQRQKEFELAEFKMLHSEEGGERDQGGDRCRSSCPFFDQLPCVCQVLLDCCMVQGLGGLGLWKGERATRVGFQRHRDTSYLIILLHFPGQSTTEASWCSAPMAWPSGPTLTTSSSLKISGPCESCCCLPGIDRLCVGLSLCTGEVLRFLCQQAVMV